MRRAITVSVAALALAAAGGVALTLLTPSSAECDDPALCRPQQTRLNDHGYLRALSLDIRGVAPTPAEYAAMEEAGGVSEETIDEWLRTEQFARRVVRRHRELLWPNIENTGGGLYHYRRMIGTYSGYDTWQLRNQQAREQYRGADVGCLDEPATIVDGVIQTTPGPDGSQQEGYVMVRPYWDPSTPIQVCAFDAQEARYSPSGTDCSTSAAISDPGCGCGPNLRWCGSYSMQDDVLEAFADELEERIAAHVMADEPYHELLTSRRAFVNGPLAHYWRHHRNINNRLSLVPDSMELESVPLTDIEVDPENPQAVDPADGLPFDADDEWREIELPEQHAGLLTHPVYLLRFQTNRARANRFYDAFLCQPFQPPEGGIPLDDEVAAAQPDVQQRPGCNYCHAILEPAAAHWGRWQQQGGGYLRPSLYPEFRQECADCGRRLEPCSDLCRDSYVTRALSPEEEPYLGYLRAYEFLRPEHEPNIEAGPTALVRQGLADGRFTSCAVRRTAEWLLARPVGEEEEPWLRELTQEFLGSDFRYRELVRAIVTSETYRRAL
jgi:hypothetical protein